MVILDCLTCKQSFPNKDELCSHILNEHFPHSNINEKNSSNEGENDPTKTSIHEQSCPGCDFPVQSDSQSFAAHLACFTDYAESTVASLYEFSGGLCPLCGKYYDSIKSLERHLNSHDSSEKYEILSTEGACTVCEKSAPSLNSIGQHMDCFIKSNVPPIETNRNQHKCPDSECSMSSKHREELLWHIWITHLGADIQNDNISATILCPGCDKQISFGELRSHLTCIEQFNGPKSASLIYPLFKSCFLCSFSAFNSRLLQKHLRDEHQEILLNDEKCGNCGESIGKDYRSHYICFDRTTDIQIDWSIYSGYWPCPSCNSHNQSQYDLYKHITEEHIDSLFKSQTCQLCGDQIRPIEEHDNCLAQLGIGDSQHISTNLNLARPAAIIASHDREKTKHNASVPLPAERADDYFDELTSYVQLELDTERDKKWKQYTRRESIYQLSQETNLIWGLESFGSEYHPNHDLQIVFRLPLKEGADPENLSDLAEKFNIYPGQHVIISVDDEFSDQQHGLLPISGIVTFIDNQTIGIVPDAREKQEAVKQALSNENITYHIVDLLNSRPYQRELDAIERLASNQERRQLVTGQKELVEYETDITDLYTGTLNSSQQQAIERALGAEDIFCIHGPPGTGKTRTLTALIEIAVAQGKRVLATAHSNQAVDNLMAGTSTLNNVDSGSLHHTAEEQEAFTMSRIGTNSKNKVITQYYQGVPPNNAQVVGATTNAAAELADNKFDIVVVDEASQANQPASFIPSLKGAQLVLAGDHKQLPPYCSIETAKEEQMHISLFEQLQNRYGSVINEQLRRQYRMNAEIADFISKEFYHGTLNHGDQNRDWTVSDLKPIVAFDTNSHEQTHKGSSSKFNEFEAELVAMQVRLLQMNDLKASEIGIITPYTAQINTIKNAIKNERITNSRSIKIDTIDSFQGSEREAIIVSFVRSNSYNASGFLEFLEEGKRRLNVALTRAKRRLVIIGDFETLSTVADDREETESCAFMYERLHEYLKQRKLVKSVQE